jgi:hypothetical protein
VPEQIVDVLEVVDIDHQHADGAVTEGGHLGDE